MSGATSTMVVVVVVVEMFVKKCIIMIDADVDFGQPPS